MITESAAFRLPPESFYSSLRLVRLGPGRLLPPARAGSLSEADASSERQSVLPLTRSAGPPVIADPPASLPRFRSGTVLPVRWPRPSQGEPGCWRAVSVLSLVRFRPSLPAVVPVGIAGRRSPYHDSPSFRPAPLRLRFLPGDRGRSPSAWRLGIGVFAAHALRFDPRSVQALSLRLRFSGIFDATSIVAVDLTSADISATGGRQRFAWRVRFR